MTPGLTTGEPLKAMFEGTAEALNREAAIEPLERRTPRMITTMSQAVTYARNVAHTLDTKPQYAPSSPAKPMGKVFTRRWIVDWILDLCGYSEDTELFDRVLVEPSCGTGAFLLPAIERLLASCRAYGVDPRDAKQAILGVDLHPESAEIASERVMSLLRESGLSAPDSAILTKHWVRHDDFLLSGETPPADFVVGNPPYVRLEDIPADLAATYRERWKTMTGRADLYVGFYECGLQLLKPGGRLGFICADRWMRNSYGAGLRKLITSGGFAVETLVKLHEVNCFDKEVAAYPAITVLSSGEQSEVALVDTAKGFTAEAVPDVAKALNDQSPGGDVFSVGRLDRWFGSDIWPEGTVEKLDQIADHEKRHQPLEDVLRQTRVGIGVATGKDEIYITTDPTVVEPERVLPLVLAKHITQGVVDWTPTYLINPWESKGLVDLSEFPLFEVYMRSHESRLSARHTARKSPLAWYRTIDRVHPWLTTTPKILLADMKSQMTPVIDRGDYYPHHNLYWITSVRWDLDVLAGLLLSEQAEQFVRSYGVKMRGDTLRMQAQYLRKIRLPEPESLTTGEADDLRDAYARRDREAATRIAEVVYERRDP